MSCADEQFLNLKGSKRKENHSLKVCQSKQYCSVSLVYWKCRSKTKFKNNRRTCRSAKEIM